MHRGHRDLTTNTSRNFGAIGRKNCSADPKGPSASSSPTLTAISAPCPQLMLAGWEQSRRTRKGRCSIISCARSIATYLRPFRVMLANTGRGDLPAPMLLLIGWTMLPCHFGGKRLLRTLVFGWMSKCYRPDEIISLPVSRLHSPRLRLPRIMIPLGVQQSDPLPRRPRLNRAPSGVPLLRASVIPWHADIDHHCQAWVDNMHEASIALVTRSPPSARQPYLTSDTLSLVVRRRGIRQYIRQEEQELDRRWKLIAFAACVLHARGQVFSDAAQITVANWLADLDYSIATAVELLQETTSTIRAAVKRDRVAYLSGLADAVTKQDLRAPKALYSSVRRAFPAARAARRQNLSAASSCASG